ncbi:hypothetical protein BJ508DRAFT_365736 [Ascobolus immersus RN42]|uniref:Uncharacterized protein n=1 Tax=Ascobolus immersus RN42 TaxID=1160509 RepID=A0A3N4HTJ9_ASCIM|nr:hypothetical protein BJ508DRAFT_365736 [Ascobolus immersus RN42]
MSDVSPPEDLNTKALEIFNAIPTDSENTNDFYLFDDSSTYFNTSSSPQPCPVASEIFNNIPDEIYTPDASEIAKIFRDIPDEYDDTFSHLYPDTAKIFNHIPERSFDRKLVYLHAVLAGYLHDPSLRSNPKVVFQFDSNGKDRYWMKWTPDKPVSSDPLWKRAVCLQIAHPVAMDWIDFGPTFRFKVHPDPVGNFTISIMGIHYGKMQLPYENEEEADELTPRFKTPFFTENWGEDYKAIFTEASKWGGALRTFFTTSTGRTLRRVGKKRLETSGEGEDGPDREESGLAWDGYSEWDGSDSDSEEDATPKDDADLLKANNQEIVSNFDLRNSDDEQNSDGEGDSDRVASGLRSPSQESIMPDKDVLQENDEPYTVITETESYLPAIFWTRLLYVVQLRDGLGASLNVKPPILLGRLGELMQLYNGAKGFGSSLQGGTHVTRFDQLFSKDRMFPQERVVLFIYLFRELFMVLERFFRVRRPFEQEIARCLEEERFRDAGEAAARCCKDDSVGYLEMVEKVEFFSSLILFLLRARVPSVDQRLIRYLGLPESIGEGKRWHHGVLRDP